MRNEGRPGLRIVRRTFVVRGRVSDAYELRVVPDSKRLTWQRFTVTARLCCMGSTGRRYAKTSYSAKLVT